MSEKLAFTEEYKGYKVEAYWGDGADARLLITRPGGAQKTLFYPAYKIFNIQAHWTDIVEGELRESSEGWAIAGATGFGGCVMPSEEKS